MLSTLIYFKVTEMFPGITRIFKLHWRRSTGKSVWFCRAVCILQLIDMLNCVTPSWVRPGTRFLRYPSPGCFKVRVVERFCVCVWFWTLAGGKHCCSWRAVRQMKRQKSTWNPNLSLLPSALPPHSCLCPPPAAWHPTQRWVCLPIRFEGDLPSPSPSVRGLVLEGHVSQRARLFIEVPPPTPLHPQSLLNRTGFFQFGRLLGLCKLRALC